MKRTLSFFSSLLIVVVNLGAAVYAASITAPGRRQREWNEFFAMLENQRWSVFGAGILFFLLWLLFFWSRYARRGPRERFLAFDTDQGPISISTLAIADFIIRLATEFPSITRISPHVVPRHKMIDVLLNVRVKSGTQVNEMCQLLQQRVRQSLTDEMGIPEVNDIKINVDGITGEHRAL